MMLVVGGAHSGKRTFVREKLGFAADDFVDAAACGGRRARGFCRPRRIPC